MSPLGQFWNSISNGVVVCLKRESLAVLPLFESSASSISYKISLLSFGYVGYVELQDIY